MVNLFEIASPLRRPVAVLGLFSDITVQWLVSGPTNEVVVVVDTGINTKEAELSFLERGAPIYAVFCKRHQV